MSSPAHFQFVTAFPQMIDDCLRWGVVGQARKKDLLKISLSNPRSFTQDVHQTIDDRPFGGGDGMILMAEPLGQAIEGCLAREPGSTVIYLSPHGSRLDDRLVTELAKERNYIFICGRYGGIDQRVVAKYVHREISVGDYVLSGGELAACVVADCVARQYPGVLGHAESAQAESFRHGLLEAPSFTRPREIWDYSVPEILTSGHHGRIQEWNGRVSRLLTLCRRPDLFEIYWNSLGNEERKNQWEELSKFCRDLPHADKKLLGLENCESALSDWRHRGDGE